jgi:hypothetical protein
VEYHLHKIFTKLGVTAQGQLHLALAARVAASAAEHVRIRLAPTARSAYA